MGVILAFRHLFISAVKIDAEGVEGLWSSAVSRDEMPIRLLYFAVVGAARILLVRHGD